MIKINRVILTVVLMSGSYTAQAGITYSISSLSYSEPDGATFDEAYLFEASSTLDSLITVNNRLDGRTLDGTRPSEVVSSVTSDGSLAASVNYVATCDRCLQLNFTNTRYGLTFTNESDIAMNFNYAYTMPDLFVEIVDDGFVDESIPFGPDGTDLFGDPKTGGPLTGYIENSITYTTILSTGERGPTAGAIQRLLVSAGGSSSSLSRSPFAFGGNITEDEEVFFRTSNTFGYFLEGFSGSFEGTILPGGTLRISTDMVTGNWGEIIIPEGGATGIHVSAGDPYNILNGGNALRGSLSISEAPVVTTVPLPSAFWLFISGLAGLIGWRRRSGSI